MGESYRDEALRLDKLSHRDSLFIANCRRVAQLFRDDPTDSQDPDQNKNLCWLYDLDDGADIPPQAEHFAARFANGDANNQERNQILFMCGYPDATTIRQIGECFRLDMTFFDRHLSYYKDEIATCHIHPSHHDLPSRQQIVFQTLATTVGGVTGKAKPESLEARRKVCEKQMKAYMHKLRMRRDVMITPFQSVVRGFELYDESLFSLSQAITVSIKHQKDEKEHWLRTQTTPRKNRGTKLTDP